MYLRVLRRAACLLSALLAWTAGSAALAEPPSSPPRPTAGSSTSNDPEVFLQRALELERKRNWPAALELYQEALELWPSRMEFSHRRRLCEAHYRLNRRYQDQSFRNVLLRLPRDKALELFDEVLVRIESHYVDPVGLESLVRKGIDNLEVALRDPAFLRANGIDATAERVTWLRQALQRYRDPLNVPDRAAAQGMVLTACDLAQRAINLAPAPVILEFAYGACDALDDYTSYLTPDKLEDLYAMIDGNFVGLGIELKLDSQGLRLVGVIRGGPAWDAGLKVNDVVTQVNGKPVRGQSLDEAASKLQGNEGTAVAITVLHPDGTSASYRLIRRHVEVESVAQARIVDRGQGIGYLQLTGFQKTSADELDQAIVALRQQGMRSLVLDLRGNPGGLLNMAVEIADRFLVNGVIVTTRGRASGQSQVFRSHGQPHWTMPLFVLIDHDSASASEILAGALKDHGRATVLGERSYGKGSVQSIFALRAAPAGLKLTTAKFYSPNNRPYSEQGVEPDILVKVAAKPTGREKKGAEAAPVTFGDPDHDPALEQAIRQARRQLNPVR
jgi:carboxyl-terminal processing protease